MPSIVLGAKEALISVIVSFIESFYNNMKCYSTDIKLSSAPAAVRAWALGHSSISIHTPHREAGE